MSDTVRNMDGMDIDDAASKVAEALVAKHLQVGLASHSQGVILTVQEHPGAVLYFSFDQLGGLLTELEFDGRPRERLNYTPTNLEAQQIADYVADKIAGVGGHAPFA